MNDTLAHAVQPRAPLTRAGLRTPRAAAAAGIIFSILLIWSLWLLRSSIPADGDDNGVWVGERASQMALALNLVPFIGVAFIWFLGVLRDRLGAMEDQFFATVFLGSGLLFLGMIFVAAAAALALTKGRPSGAALDPGTYNFGRGFVQAVMRIYAFKMAAVFMMTTSTMAIYIRFTPRWIALLGYAAAAFLLFGSTYIDWALFVFPCWVLVVSLDILMENPQRPTQAEPIQRGIGDGR